MSVLRYFIHGQECPCSVILLMQYTIIITQMAGGGMERFATTVCNVLASQSRDVLLCALHPSPANAPADWLEDSVPLRTLNCSAKRAAPSLIRLCRERAGGPVLALSLEVALVLLFLKRFKRIDNPILYRESTAVLQHNSPIWKYLIRWMLPHADGLIVQSRQGLRDLQTLFSPAMPVLHLRNPCVYLESPPIRERPVDSATAAPRLLVMGRMEAMKGQQRVLAAMPALLQKFPEARLKLVGTGSRMEALRDLCQSMGVADAVEFAGFMPDPRPAYAQADVLVLPSDYEGLPNVIPEAIACGCRVIASDGGGGIRECMEDLGLEGFLLPLDEFETRLPGLVAEVLASSDAVWQAARQKLMDTAHPQKVADQLEAFFEVVGRVEGGR